MDSSNKELIEDVHTVKAVLLSFLIWQKKLDEIIRMQKGKNELEKLLNETSTFRCYRLSNGSSLTISKITGEGQIKDANGKIILDF